MRRYFWLAGLAQVRRGFGLYALTVAGVALGVASASSIQILNRSALAAFEASLEAVSGTSDLSVVGPGGSLPEKLLPVVLATRGVASAWPLVRVDVALAPPLKGSFEIVACDVYTAQAFVAGAGAQGRDRDRALALTWGLGIGGPHAPPGIHSLRRGR